MDTGSTVSLIHRDLKEELQVKGSPRPFSLAWTNGTMQDEPDSLTVSIFFFNLAGKFIPEERAKQIMKRTLRKREKGYEIGLLWKTEDINLPESYGQASRRLQSLERKLAQDEILKKWYHEEIAAYCKKGYARALDTCELIRKENNPKVNYIPHFAVVNYNKPIPKPRIVFDAAAKNRDLEKPIPTATVRLPKLDLPTFDGNSTEWISFKDRFVSMIHEAEGMKDVIKLQYLLSVLKGEVAKRFQHVKLTTDNYNITWKALLDRYDHKRDLKREYFRALFSIPPMKNEMVEELR
ncbi:uncharacterized protein LOC128710874 [Anopheles marshallii]|uniref:uncharacterized protein LOC128710874 n=1 Tax=Anopheles marshallii TaxID=1521116 RepID=UPI00237BB1CD|nr:uncharacterized protein LOC128710874 [Anopheles marshallii]